MSIREFDPILKRAALSKDQNSRSKIKGRNKTIVGGAPEDVHALNTSTSGVVPIKMNVGRQNISVDGSSESSLYQGLKSAFDELGDNFKWYCDQIDTFLPNDLTLALEPTLELSAYYCPKDTEALVNSRYLATESYRGGARCEIGYAKGGEPHYAIYVHEIPATHEPPTCDKFLQRAIDEDYFNILTRISHNVRIRSGIGT